MKHFIFLLFIIYGLLNVATALAAKLELNSLVSEIGIGQELQVNLTIDTQSEDINAVEAKISFPEQLLKLKEIRDGNSIINFWIERPKIEKAGIINFSGIIPGGYKETKGFLFSIILEAKKSGGGIVEISNAKILRNDGKGTVAPLTISNFQFLISEQVPIYQIPIIETKDVEPPEEFKPEITHDPSLFDNKWFLVFTTQDKGSGIDHYKVCEKVKTTCVIAESPYVLQNQNLDGKIFVHAIDKNGNERIVILPSKFAPWYKKPIVDIVLSLIALVVLLFSIWFWRKYTKHHE